MNEIAFGLAFEKLTGHKPFPWQQALYQRFATGDCPDSCNLPTGLGKTSVIAVWLIALTNGKPVPRRLVYVVNRRTVVDQTTDEVEKYRKNLTAAGISMRLALSTLRGQFADNREWSADPSCPAVICGTVDMIGSRLLFSGYGVGFKARPLHAGFLGQDVLLVHDEAHLEPAFQKLVIAIQHEQHEWERTGTLPWPKLRVMELTATSRSSGAVFSLSDEDRAEPEVRKRINAKKSIQLHETKDEKKLAEEIAALALIHKDSGGAVLVFVRKVEDVEKVVKKLPKGSAEQLTGTLRGLERDTLVEKPIFQRFHPPSNRNLNAAAVEGTVYLVCTSAGEVGVNISADHLVCDLSTFDSMAQRFGRVNRFGLSSETQIHVVHPQRFDEKDDYDSRLKNTLALLRELNGDASPAAIGNLDPKARQDAFAPTPTILPTSDILFDAWALTSIRGTLPGRPMVEPYLHGISGAELPETYVAWREEVWALRLQFEDEEDRRQREPEERKQLSKFAVDLLEDYPLKPHELLREPSYRAFKHMEALANRRPNDPVWLVADDDTVEVLTLKELADKDEKDRINGKTILLPPIAGGLERGMLNGESATADDVADQWFFDKDRTKQRRIRRRDAGDPGPDFRLVREIVLGSSDDEEAEPTTWRWYVRPDSADDDGSKTARHPVTWADHTKDVTKHAKQIASVLLKDHPDLHRVLVVAAMFHDLGKKRVVWQRSIGNPHPHNWLAKSGKGMKPRELTRYRHEFGSLVDLEGQPEFLELSEDQQELVRHLIAAHHGRGRPHFSADEAFDPLAKADITDTIADTIPQRYGRLQRKYGRWGLAYLESLLRAADIAASVEASMFVKDVT